MIYKFRFLNGGVTFFSKKQKCILFVILFLFAGTQSYSQFFVGGGFGIFSKNAENKGVGPTVNLLYSKDFLKQSAFFFNTSLYKKNGVKLGNVEVYNGTGTIVGSAEKSVNISTTHYQLGFLRNLGSKENAPMPNLFLGAGLVLSKVKATYNYTLTGQNVPSDKISNSIYGFHFSAGVHSQINRFIIELKGSFDFMLSADIKEYDIDESLKHVNSTRLSIYYPLTK